MAQKNLQISDLYDIYGALLPEKQKIALEYYYNDDLSLSEIAELTGISRQGVRDQIKHAENQLLQYESALNLYQKSIETSKALDSLLEICKSTNNSQLLKIHKNLTALNE